jgi:hypothetical protein
VLNWDTCADSHQPLSAALRCQRTASISSFITPISFECTVQDCTAHQHLLDQSSAKQTSSAIPAPAERIHLLDLLLIDTNEWRFSIFRYATAKLITTAKTALSWHISLLRCFDMSLICGQSIFRNKYQDCIEPGHIPDPQPIDTSQPFGVIFCDTISLVVTHSKIKLACSISLIS